MNIGSVFTIGGWFLIVAGALLSLVFGSALMGAGQKFPMLIGLLVLGVGPIAAGLALVGAGGRRSRLERESAQRGFEDAVTAAARGHDGQISLGEVTRVTSLPSDEAQAKMRALVGRGLFDLDFDANGQIVYKLSASQGAAQLAQLSGRS